jgi:carbon storage regulator
MLVLTRRLGEGVTIGQGIRVVVLAIKGRQVRLGIEAPPQTEIYRDEIYTRMVEENRKAAETAPGEMPLGPWLKGRARRTQRSSP